jgi:hypothetical protein
MAEYQFLPPPTEDYKAWLAANDCPGVTADTMLQTSLNGNGDLVFHIVIGEDLEEFVCDGDCESCPVADSDCDGECLSCPCYANCEDSDYTLPEGMCKSHGNRRDSLPGDF